MSMDSGPFLHSLLHFGKVSTKSSECEELPLCPGRSLKFLTFPLTARLILAVRGFSNSRPWQAILSRFGGSRTINHLLGRRCSAFIRVGFPACYGFENLVTSATGC